MKTFLILLFSAFTVSAATFNAATASLADVTTAVGLASDGDTVTIPAGSAGWASTGLTITHAIVLQGAGIGQTIITDNVVSGNDSTITMTLVASKTNSRITGISFVGGTHNGNYGGIQIQGSFVDGRRGRIDHCSFTNIVGRTCTFIQGAFGVTDHCTYSESGGTFSHDIWGYNAGDENWTNTTSFGTDKFWYIEDCTYTNTGSLYEMVDSVAGGRWVVRHCLGLNTRLSTHGTDSTSNRRGTRAIEIYNNTIGGDGVTSELLALRSGCAVIHDNTVTNWNAASGEWGLHVFRGVDGEGGEFVPWGGADGTNTWDINNASNPFETGTATGGAALTMIKSGATWASNQWVGYTLRNLSVLNHSEITSNSATTITFLPGRYNANMSFANGNTYNITKVTQAIDQPGIGIGSLINTSGSATSPAQSVDPVYEWGNTVNGSATGYSVDSYMIVLNTHYKLNTSAPGYVAYTYPHPLTGYVPPGTITNTLNGTLTLNGKATFN